MANNIFKIFFSINPLLSQNNKAKTRWIYFLNTLISFADIIGLSSMVPVLMLAIDHSFLEKSRKLRYIYQLFGFQTESNFLIWLLIVIFLFFLIKNICSILLTKYTNKIATNIATEFAQKSFFKIFEHNSYDKVQRAGLGFSDALFFTPYYFVSGIYLPAINLVSETAVMTMLVVIFTIYKPILFFLLVGILGSAFFLVNKFTRKRVTELGNRSRAHRDEALAKINFGMSGFTDIKTHNAAQFFYDRFSKVFENFAAAGTKSIGYQLIPARINEFAALCGIILLVIYAYFYNRENTGEVRVLAALFAISAFRLIPAANRLLNAIMHLKMNSYTVDQLNLAIKENANVGEKIDSFTSQITISDLNFQYPNRAEALFDNISLEIKKGDWLGLAGESGAGKTTLVKILLGLQTANSGVIACDGKEISGPGALQPLMAYVSQEPYVFVGSVKENLIFGKTDLIVDNAELLNCLNQAAFYCDVDESKWLDYQTGEGGMNLSVGQKQRLAIARALYHKTEIIIFDEPTAALDEETEEKLMEGLLALKKLNKTIVIIAHRRGIFELCNRVYEIKNKKLVSIKPK